MILSILAVLLPLLTGLLISAALVVRAGSWKEWLLAFFLAPGVGITVSSILYFFWFILLQPTTALPAYVALEGALLVGIGFALRRSLRHPPAALETSGCAGPLELENVGGAGWCRPAGTGPG